MKKIIALVICLLLSVFSVQAEEDNITVYVDNVKVEFDVAPELKNDRTFVPIRKVAEMLSLEVGYIDETREVTLDSSDISIRLLIDSDSAYVNDEEKTLDVAPYETNGRTLVPLRFVSEVLNCKVEWVGDTNSVYITKSAEEINTGVLSYACAQLITQNAEFYTFTDDAIYYINKVKLNETQYLYKYDYKEGVKQLIDITNLSVNNMKGYTVNALETDTVTGDVWISGLFNQGVSGNGTVLYNANNSYVVINELDSEVKDVKIQAVSDGKALLGNTVINLNDKEIEEKYTSLKGDTFFGHNGEFYASVTSGETANIYKISDYENKIFSTTKFFNYAISNGCLYIKNKDNIECINLDNPADTKTLGMKLDINLKFINETERFTQLGKKMYVNGDTIIAYSGQTKAFTLIADEDTVNEYIKNISIHKPSVLTVLAEDIELNDYVIQGEELIYINNVIDSADWVKDNKVYKVNVKTGEKSVLFDFENYTFDGYTGFIPEYILKDNYTQRVFVSGKVEKRGENNANKSALFEIAEEPRFIAFTGEAEAGHNICYVTEKKEILCGNVMYDMETGAEVKVNVVTGLAKGEEAVIFESKGQHFKLYNYLQNKNAKYGTDKNYGTAIDIKKKDAFERLYTNLSELKFYAKDKDVLYVWVYDETSLKDSCLKVDLVSLVNSRNYEPENMNICLTPAECGYPEGLEYKDMIKKLVMCGEEKFIAYDEVGKRFMVLSNN